MQKWQMRSRIKSLAIFAYSFCRHFSFRQALLVNLLNLKSKNAIYFSYTANCSNLSMESTYRLNEHLQGDQNVIMPQTRSLFQVYSAYDKNLLESIFYPNKLSIFYADYLIFNPIYFCTYIWRALREGSFVSGEMYPFSKNHLRVFIYKHIIPEIIEVNSRSTLYLYFENHANERALSCVFNQLNIKVVGLVPYYFCTATSSSIVPTSEDVINSHVPNEFYTLGLHSSKRLSTLFPNNCKISPSIIGRSAPLKKIQRISYQCPKITSIIVLLPYHLQLSKELLSIVGSLPVKTRQQVLIKLHPSHRLRYFQEFKSLNFSFEASKSLVEIVEKNRFSHCISLITSAALEFLPIPIDIFYYAPLGDLAYLPFDYDKEMLEHVSIFRDATSLSDLIESSNSDCFRSFNLYGRTKLFLNLFNQTK